MSILGSIVVFFGFAVAIIGQIWLLALAYRRSTLWFFGVLLVPIISFIFICLNFREASKCLALMFGGIFIIVAGCYLGGFDF
jgi:hypothetical protein